MDDPNYQMPTLQEVLAVYTSGYQSGVRMFDTAAAYGVGESRLGEWLRQLSSDDRSKAFVATKGNEEWSPVAGSRFIHTVDHIQMSLHRSLTQLGAIDLFYLHQSTPECLGSAEIRDFMRQQVDLGLIKLTGASSMNEALLDQTLSTHPQWLWMDVIQTGPWIIFRRPDLAKALCDRGIILVINSPRRLKLQGMSDYDALKLLAEHPHVSFALTGTMGHLAETVAAFTL